MPPAKKRKTGRSTSAKVVPDPPAADDAAVSPKPDTPSEEAPTARENEPAASSSHADITENARADAAEPATEPPAAVVSEANDVPAAESSSSATLAATKTTKGAATASAAASASSSADAAAKAQERMARFRALQDRAKKSADQNFKEATKESQRLASDPSQLAALGRKNAIASHKLMKAEVEESGGDFERKRAWDWTVEESERWDKRTRKKDAHRDDTAFRDYGHESKKVYKRQVRALGAPDLEKYTAEKMAAIDKAVAAGTLEIVETEDGEMIAVDKDGTFFSTAESTEFGQNKPDKAAVDRLVADMRKAEDAALKKRRDRMAANGDEEDVTYINEKNKQFNKKLDRFYNKYTAEIRESFERGTAI